MSAGQAWNRREFVGTITAAAAAALTTPLAAGPTTTAQAPAEVGAELLADWTIDDMFGVWPRYADPIPEGRDTADAAAPGEEPGVPA